MTTGSPVAPGTFVRITRRLCYFMYGKLKEIRRLCCFIRSKPQVKSVSAKYVKIVCFFSNVCMILFIAE